MVWTIPPATFPISKTYYYMSQMAEEFTWGGISLGVFLSALGLRTYNDTWARGVSLVLLSAWYGVIGFLSFLSVPWSLAPGLMLPFTLLCYLLIWKT